MPRGVPNAKTAGTKSKAKTEPNEDLGARAQNPDPENPATFPGRVVPATGPEITKPPQKLLDPGLNPDHAPHVIVNRPFGSEPRTLDPETGAIQPPTPSTEAIEAGAKDGERVEGQSALGNMDTFPGGGAPQDTVEGGEGGSDRGDTIEGGSGNDTTNGGQGNDTAA